jgi:hypothetical protein
LKVGTSAKRLKVSAAANNAVFRFEEPEPRAKSLTPCTVGTTWLIT